MRTKINFRLGIGKKRAIGCLDPETGIVTNAKDKAIRHIDHIKKYDPDVRYFETCKKGKVIQKSGEWKK